MKNVHLATVLIGLVGVYILHGSWHLFSSTTNAGANALKKSLAAPSSVSYNLQNMLPHIVLSLPDNIERTKKNHGTITTYMTRGGPLLDDRLAIVVRYRGSSSFDHYPKKSYSLSLDDASDRPFSLLDMPPGKSWALYAPYGDKTLIRNVLAYNLYNLMGRYAPRTRLVTLDIKDSTGKVAPAGIYVLIEKIKIAPERLNIGKKRHQHQFAYLMRFDPIKNRQYVKTNRNSYILVNYPKEPDLDAATREFILSYLNEFEGHLFSPDKGQFQLAIAMIDIDALVDYVILQELTRNIDGYRRSCYFYLPIGGKLTFGPPWDFEKTFGNVDRYDGFKPDGFQFNMEGGVGWFQKLMTHPQVKEAIKRRWTSLRSGPLADKTIIAVIDEEVRVMPPAVVDENFRIWPIMGAKVWLNYAAQNSYSEEVSSLKDWIKQRATWLDTAIPTL